MNQGLSKARMVAEFEPQRDLYMIWPERPDNWRDGAKPAQAAFADLANLLVGFEPVTMFVSTRQYLNARKRLVSQIRVLELSSNDVFIKDTGPIYTEIAGRLQAVSFDFNAWGGLLDGLYFPWDQDQLIGQKMAELNRIPYTIDHDLVVEGCSILTDGEGTLFSTEDVLLSEGRNPGRTRVEIEGAFKQILGIQKVIWLQHGYFLDETNGAIDNMVNFIQPGEVVLTWTNNSADPMYATVREAEAILANTTDAKGRSLKIHHLLMPGIQRISQQEASGIDPINGLLPRTDGQRLTTSYVNFITLNQAIIVPQFDDPQDSVALTKMQQLFPDKEVVPFQAREMILGGGNIHTIVHTRPDVNGLGARL